MWSKRNLPVIVVLCAVALVYANSLHNSFHFDDFHTITDNPAVRALANVPRFFTDGTLFSVLPANQTWRPIVSTSLALDYAIGDGSVVAFHLSTLFWFLALIVLLERFCELLLERVEPSPGNRWLALAVAAWFGLHPAMAETVNYIIQRGDLYCTLGVVGALWVFARWPGLRRTGLYLLPFALAMLSKPPAVVFPLLLLAYLLLFENEALPGSASWRRSLLAAAPAFLASAALLVLEHAMTPRTYAPTDLSPWAYRLTQPFVWLRYAGELFLPLHLNADTDLARFDHLNSEAIAGILFALALIAAIILCARRRRLAPIAFGLAWFLITQLPTSLYALAEVENDHRMFFSFPGLMLAVVWSLYLLAQTIRARIAATHRLQLRIAAIAVTALLLATCAYGAYRRNEVWRDESTLWADDIAKSPHNGRGLMMYGLTKMSASDYASALVLFERAQAFTPNYPELEINLAIANGGLARTMETEAHFQRALLLAPRDDRPHAFYGRWLLQQGRIAEANAQLATAFALNPQRSMNRELLEQARASAAAGRPETAALWVDRSLALNKAGAYPQSIEAARRALALDPTCAEAWNNIAADEEALHHWDAAITAARRAIALKPTLQIARNNLAWSLQQRARETHR